MVRLKNNEPWLQDDRKNAGVANNISQRKRFSTVSMYAGGPSATLGLKAWTLARPQPWRNGECVLIRTHCHAANFTFRDGGFNCRQTLSVHMHCLLKGRQWRDVFLSFQTPVRIDQKQETVKALTKNLAVHPNLLSHRIVWATQFSKIFLSFPTAACRTEWPEIRNSRGPD